MKEHWLQVHDAAYSADAVSMACEALGMVEGKHISYGRDTRDIVEQGGIEAIRDVLYHGTYEESAGLLFCLERYLDPWFGYVDIPEFQPLIDNIFLLLQEVILDEKLNIDKREAMHQLEYCQKSFAVFEKALDADHATLGGYREWIEELVYMPKVCIALGGKYYELLHGYLNEEYSVEYILNLMRTGNQIDADPEKITEWFTRKLESERQNYEDWVCIPKVNVALGEKYYELLHGYLNEEYSIEYILNLLHTGNQIDADPEKISEWLIRKLEREKQNYTKMKEQGYIT